MNPPRCPSIITRLHPWLQLIKVPLCLPIACSAGFGSILHTPILSPSCGAVICGVFFLACGAAGCNSLQEKSTDGLLLRTCNRPMVTGRLSERRAMGLSLLLVLFGLVVLLRGTTNWSPLLLGITALVLYNGVYTPLKQSSVFALFPGGVAGAIPPLIGWTAAGGQMMNNLTLVLFSLFFLWQIPHFCLILLHHQEDYRTTARPTLIRLLPEQSLQRITLIWILAFIVVALIFTLDRNLLVTEARLVIVLMAGILTACFLPLLLPKPAPNYHFLYLILNSAFFSTMLLVAILQLHAAW